MKFLTRFLYFLLTIGLVVFAPFYANKTTSAAANRYVATTGSDTTDCSNSLTPCATIQYAINQSAAGDTIVVDSGTYTEPTNLLHITKSLTFLGKQAGVDARTRMAVPESIISNSQGTSVEASGVIVDGFKIQDSSNQAFTGYGIWLNPAVSGTQILNNIFTNNVAGLGLSNDGVNQALVKHNLFQSNNLGTSSASGTGIYTDEFVGGAVSNVLITENKFLTNANAGIGFSSFDTAHPDSDITITKNTFDQCGRGIYFFNTETVSVIENDILNSTAPVDGGSSVGIGIFGGVKDLTVTKNNIETGVSRGIRIISFIDDTHPNMNVAIHLNNIFGFAVAGMLVDDEPPSLGPALTGPADFATCNWWGSTTGPTNPTQNPGGTGDVVTGVVVTANFKPWLFGLAPDAPCGVSPATTITACKYFDKNANGVMDPTDLPINGWKITISPLGPDAVPNSATQFTHDDGCVTWSTLDTALNPYTVSEGTPSQGNWIHTTPASVQVTVSLGGTETVKFGNVCVGAGGGLTIGYWGNKNGERTIRNCSSLGGTSGTMTFLSGLNLRNADGSAFDPANFNQFNTWLQGANSTNMAYMLSAQLAAMELNVKCGGVDGTSLIYAPGTNSANAAGFATVNAVMAEANTELGAHGLTTTGSQFRAYQERLKDALDKANNNLTFVQSTPCPASF